MMSRDSTNIDEFKLNPFEQIVIKAHHAVVSIESFHRDTPAAICRNMLTLDRTAKNHMAKQAYEIALLHNWRFLLLYRRNVHEIRRSRAISIRMKSLLEEKVTSSVAAVEWLKKKFWRKHYINLLRHQRDLIRRTIGKDDLYHKVVPKAPVSGSVISKSKSFIKSIDSKSYTSRSQIPLGFDAGYQLLLKQKEKGEEERNVLVPCLVRRVLRNVYLPSEIVAEFQAKVYKNDFRKIKTTAILAASSVQGVVVVSHIIIPEQTGDISYAHVKQSKELENYMTSSNLVHIGLVYSEVRNKANLNWREAHELCDLRLKVQEAFAIVISNTRKEVEYLWLTEAGFQAISNCKEKDVHTHNLDEALYQKPVHLIQSFQYDIEVVDFRKDNKAIIQKPIQSNTRVNKCLKY